MKKANLGAALATAGKAKEVAPKSVGALDQRIADKLAGPKYDDTPLFKEKGGKMKKTNTYSYLKKAQIKKVEVDLRGKIFDIPGDEVLSGVYVKGGKKLTPMAKKVMAKKIDAEALRNKIIKYATAFYKKEYDSKIEPGMLAEIKTSDIKKFAECGLSEEMIMVFYAGWKSINAVKCDGEINYGMAGGVFSYREDYVAELIKEALEFCKNQTFEIGFKYPDFNWKKAGMLKPKTEVIDSPKYDTPRVKGKQSIVKVTRFLYKGFPMTSVSSVGDIENGKREATYGQVELLDPKKDNFNSSYLAVVSRNIYALFDLSKALLGQKESYVKDFDFLVQSKTFGVQALERFDIKFKKGGSTSHLLGKKLSKSYPEFKPTINYAGEKLALYTIFKESENKDWDTEAQKFIDNERRRGRKAAVIHKGDMHGLYLKAHFAKGGEIENENIETQRKIYDVIRNLKTLNGNYGDGVTREQMKMIISELDNPTINIKDYAKGGEIKTGAYKLRLYDEAFDNVMENGYDSMQDYLDDLNERGVGYAEYEEGYGDEQDTIYTHSEEVIDELGNDGIAYKTYSSNYAKGGEIEIGDRVKTIFNKQGKVAKIIKAEYDDVNFRKGQNKYSVVSRSGKPIGHFQDYELKKYDKGGEVLNIITFDNKVSRDEFLKEMNDVAPDNSLLILDDVSIQNMGAKSDVDFYNEQAKSFNGEFYAKGGEIGDVVYFKSGRNKDKIASGEIYRTFDDEYAIMSGFSQQLVKKSDLVDPPKTKTKKFLGLFKDGGTVTMAEYGKMCDC